MPAKPRGKPFEKGKSGNPGGRPRELKHVQELARQHTRKAIKVLANIMNDESEKASARVRAAETILDRAWGKAPATMELSGGEPRDRTHTMSEAEIDARIEQLLVSLGHTPPQAEPQPHDSTSAAVPEETTIAEREVTQTDFRRMDMTMGDSEIAQQPAHGSPG